MNNKLQKSYGVHLVLGDTVEGFEEKNNGIMIDNISRDVLKQWHLKDVADLPHDGSVTLLDARTAEEYNKGHMEGFQNTSLCNLSKRSAQLYDILHFEYRLFMSYSVRFMRNHP